MSENISQDIEISGEGNVVVGKGDVIINPLPPAEVRARHDLGILLNNVQTTWIKGVLEKSVHEAALLELGMELREDVIDNPWRMVLEGLDQPRKTLPRGTKIKEIFVEANRFLLILGEPGSGKTTTMLQLARDLIAEVDHAFTQPIPVILNLSAWTDKQQPLDDWLIAELNKKYLLPKKQGHSWLEERRILLLLDSLDEVKMENRAVCVENINQLIVDYGLQGVVVCSRAKDYTDLNVRLAFYRAIYLQPLTPGQIDEYLDRAGDKLASLRANLHADDALHSLARSPLILNIMSLAYQNTSTETLSNSVLGTDQARRLLLFDTFIARMFNRKVGKRLYDEKQTRQCLSWLARNMQRHNQNVFLIEGLQPSWITERCWQWLYFFTSRLICGALFGVSVWSIFQLLLEWYEKLTIGLIAGLSVGFIDVLRFEWLRRRRGMRKSPTFWWSVINIIVVGFIAGLIAGLIRGWRIEPIYRYWMLYFGLSFGSIFGLIFGLRGSRQSPEVDIETLDALYWSWPKAAIGGVIGGIVGPLLFGVLITLNDRWIGYWQRVGLFFGLMGAILSGLRRKIVETKSVSNQGIRLSIRNAIVGGLLFGLLFGLNVWLARTSVYWLRVGPVSGLSFVLMGALWYGGFDIIQHYTLRLILLIQGHTPANYARFLDYAVDHIFLQKVGGGYRFIHRLLLEHFANLGENGKV